MGNELIFKSLSSQTRVKMLKVLMEKNFHISGLAKEIGLSTPVVLRHVKILENAGLIRRKVIGNVHILSTNIAGLEKILEPFSEESSIEINQKESLFDAIKQLPGVEINKVGENQYITSINGEKGYYIYEVNGKPPTVPIDQYKPEKNVTLKLKKLVPVDKKKIDIKIKD